MGGKVKEKRYLVVAGYRVLAYFDCTPEGFELAKERLSMAIRGGGKDCCIAEMIYG